MSSESEISATKKRGRPTGSKTRSFIEASHLKPDVPKTPLRSTVTLEVPRTPLSAIKNFDSVLTPRRSLRKSVMPKQDYDEIILSKRALTSNNAEENSQIEEQKWTPAKVGRVSQRRPTRKGRSGKKSKVAKNLESSDETVHTSEESDDKADKLENIDRTNEGTNTDVLNTTFDKDSDELTLENEKAVEKKEAVLVEMNSIDGTVHKLEDSKHTGYESKDVNKATDETNKDVLNTTFDKDGDELTLENEKAVEKKEAVLVEMNSIDGTVHKLEDSKHTGYESKDVNKATNESNKEILNTTFDTDREENLDEENVTKSVKKKEVVLAQAGLSCIDAEAEVKYSNAKVEVKTKDTEPVHDTVGDELSIDSNVLKIINEGSQLGCTPILYDENIEADKNEVDLGCTPILNDESFEEKQENSADIEMKVQIKMAEEDIDDEVFEQRKIDGIIEKTENGSQDSTNLTTVTVYECIDLASDEDMPSLLLSDDEQNEADKNAANDTFNMSDCVFVSPPQASMSECEVPEKISQQIEKATPLAAAEKRVKELQEKYFSPTPKRTKAAPKIVLTNEENVPEVLLATPRLPTPRLPTPRLVNRSKVGTPISASKRQFVGTSASATKRELRGTPAKTSKVAVKEKKAYRFPTPYKPKKDFRFAYQDTVNKENVSECIESSTEPPLITTLEPKEIVLRSIRKRSLSVTIDGEQRKRKALNVTFFSPANQTASIADLDEKLAKSAAKTVKTLIATQNITHRKRSMSLDEKYLRQQSSKLPRPIRISPHKPRATTRTRLPNFSAIHQQQFEKMENLVDYVARKNERAQNLTNSSLKTRNVAVASPAAKKQKPAASKALVLTASNKDVSNAGKLLVLTPNKKNLPNVANLAVTNNISEKLNKRTQRHMNMFKACPTDSRSAVRKNDDIIRGVRSNRRFELMMLHRKTSGN